MMEEQEKVATEVAEHTTTEASTEATEEAKPKKEKKAKKQKDPNAPKGWKGWSKGKKIGVISGAVAGALVLIAIISLCIWAFTGGGPAGAVDTTPIHNEFIKNDKGENIYYLGDQGIFDNAIVLEYAFEDKGYTDVKVDESKAEIKDFPQNGGKDGTGRPCHLIVPKSKTDDFNISAKKDGKAVTFVVKQIKGINVYEETWLMENAKGSNTVVFQSDITVSPEAQAMVLKDGAHIYGNQFTLDATPLSGVKHSSVFNIEGGTKEDPIVVQDLHIIGEIPTNKDDEGNFSLDEFEGNGEIFRLRGEGSGYPVAVIDHCLVENGAKLVWMANADLTIKNTIMRNGADALIAIETNAHKGAQLHTENVILGNSVVVGILFCGWTDITGHEAEYACSMDAKGFLDIYNWKGTDTAKLVPATEAAATLVNKMVGGEIKKLVKDKDAQEKYLVQAKDGEWYVQMGIIKLATGSLKYNPAKICGIDNDFNDKGMTPITVGSQDLVMRGFPIPDFAKVIAHDVRLISNTQSTVKADGVVNPGEIIASSPKLAGMGFSAEVATK